MTTAEEIRARLAGYNPAAAKENEAKGSHEQNRKFAPPWYELFHFRATLKLDSIRPNQSGIEQVVFTIPGAEVFDMNPKAGGSYSDLQITLPKDPPGYPTDEANLMLESLQAHKPEATSLADFDGLDVELELDYVDHPWMKERDKDGKEYVRDGVAQPKRCWYYKTIAVYGNSKATEAPKEPKPESVKKLAEWCVGKTLEEASVPGALTRGAIGLKVQSDNPLMLLAATPEKFFAYAAGFGLVMGEDEKFAIV